MSPKPGQTVCGDIDMRIDGNGTWFHQGSPIGRKELVRLFASVLRRDEDGAYWLITPAEMARIQVEDAPFLAVELTATGEGPEQTLTIRTNLDATVTIGEEHPLRLTFDPETGEPAPYVVLKGGIEAKITRAVYYELVSLGVEENPETEKNDATGRFGVWSGGVFFSLGQLDAME